MEEKLTLARGTHVIVRNRHEVQWGLDATQSGILPVGRALAAHVAAVFLTLRRTPLALPEVVARLEKCGIDAWLARVMIDDLRSYRIIIPVPRPNRRVLLLGRSMTANVMADILRHAGVLVERTEAGFPDDYMLKTMAKPTTDPVIVVDRAAHFELLAPWLHAKAQTVVPVNLVDSTGVIGPLRLDGEGPCVLCSMLHQVETDPRWVHVVRQTPLGAPTPQPAFAYAVAARAAWWVQTLLDAPFPPGAPIQRLRPGFIETFSPLTGEVSAATMQTHRRCYVCFHLNDSAARISAGTAQEIPATAGQTPAT